MKKMLKIMCHNPGTWHDSSQVNLITSKKLCHVTWLWHIIQRWNFKTSYIIPFSIQTIFPKPWRRRIFQTTPRLFHQAIDRFAEIDNKVL